MKDPKVIEKLKEMKEHVYWESYPNSRLEFNVSCLAYLKYPYNNRIKFRIEDFKILYFTHNNVYNNV